MSLGIADAEQSFIETVRELLAPFNGSDLPFTGSAKSSRKAVNSQAKFKCWSIENPVNRTLQRSFLTQLEPYESREFVVVI